MSTRQVYQNKRNEHKYLLLTVYPCRHYYIKQFMVFENGVIYGNGGRTSKGRLSRVSVKTFLEIIDDYNLIVALPYKTKKVR